MVEMTCNKLFNEYLTNTVIMVVSEYTNGLENSMVNEISKICIRQGVKYRTVRDNDYGVFSELIKAMSRTDTSEV
jgi:hypothetical protein